MVTAEEWLSNHAVVITFDQLTCTFPVTFSINVTYTVAISMNGGAYGNEDRFSLYNSICMTYDETTSAASYKVSN